MKMKTLYAALSGAFLLGAATLVPAQSTPSSAARAVTPDKMENKSQGISRDEYKVEKDRIEADAKAAKAKCKDLKANAKDICEAEAKANEKVAKKELDYKKNPNEKNRQDVEKVKAEAAYEVAKEKCEDQKGNEQHACKKQAKADKDHAMAALKGNRKTVADSSAARSGSTAGNTGGSATSSSTAPSANAAGTSGTATGSSQTKTGK